MHLFFAVVAKQYLSQRLWQFPLLFRRNSGLGLLQFLFLWQMMKSYKVWDVLLPEISRARGLFYCFFWPEALLCTTRIFTKKSCKEAFCTLVNKVWISGQVWYHSWGWKIHAKLTWVLVKQELQNRPNFKKNYSYRNFKGPPFSDAVYRNVCREVSLKKATKKGSFLNGAFR